MGLIGVLYHTAKSVYVLANSDSDKVSEELDKVVDSLHRTTIF